MKCQCQVFAASARRRAGAAAGGVQGGDEGDVRQDRHPPAAGQQAQVTTNRNVGGARLRSVNRLVSISFLPNA
jgi:hypothetical protein